MKIQKMLKVTMILVGLTAALVVAKPVRAQQDAAPDNFPDTSDSSPVLLETSQASLVPVTAQTPASSAIIADSSAAQELEASLLNPVDTTTVIVLVFGLGLVALFGIVEAARKSESGRRQDRIAYTTNFGLSA